MIAQWETGVRKPGVDSLFTLAKPLGVPFAWLAVGEGPPLLTPGSTKQPAHNSALNMACIETVVDFLQTHNFKIESIGLPDLIQDLYERASQAGLAHTNRTRSGFKLALKELAAFKFQIV